MTPKRADDDRAVGEQPLHELGTLVPSRNSATSKIETTIRDALMAADVPIERRRMAVVCLDPETNRQAILTPDFVVADARLAIEIDPCGATKSGHGFTHRGEEVKDRKRNLLMAEAGWTVIRLRLGAEPEMHIGDRDVVVESSSATKEAVTALLTAVDDLIQQRPAAVRVVRKGKRPAPAQRRQHVVNIGPDRYSDDAFWFTWYPSLDQSTKHTMRLCAGGRYIYDYDQLFVAEVGLHEVPRAEWRDRLTATMREINLTDTRGTKWPWGDTLFVADPNDADGLAIQIAAEHPKRTILRTAIWFTTSCTAIATWTPQALQADGSAPIASLHDAAVNIGYKITAVRLLSGAYGPYQRIDVARPTRIPD